MFEETAFNFSCLVIVILTYLPLLVFAVQYATRPSNNFFWVGEGNGQAHPFSVQGQSSLFSEGSTPERE